MKTEINVKELLNELNKYKEQLVDSKISEREYTHRVGGVNAAIIIIRQLANQ